jgi:carbon-monoxide dehydrogenase medium subunit
MKLRLAEPSALIDIGHVSGMKGIEQSNGVLKIGALTPHADIASSDAVQQASPILAEAAAMIGDPQVRNRGTIGGNVAHADPSSDLPTVLTALGATFRVTGPNGERSIPAAAFFQGLMSTALSANEVLTSVEIPALASGQGTAYAKFFHPASRYAVIGAAAIVTVSGGKCTAASVVLGGLVSSPAKATLVEAALTGNALDEDTIAAAAANTSDDLGNDVLGDVFASAEYRRSVASVYVGRAITAAAERAG